MKVLLVNHGTAGDWGGGDSVQIRETAKRLVQRGHNVAIRNDDRPDVQEFDLVHIFNCRVQHSFVSQVSACKAANKPVVVSPIWINIGKALWGSRGTFGVLRKGIAEGAHSIQAELEKLKERELIVHLEAGSLDASGKGSYDMSWLSSVKETLKAVDGVLANSWLELKSVQNDLNWSGTKYNVAEYGADPKIFLDADPQLFREHTGLKEPFVMQAGRIEPAKNQAMMCWALKNTNMPIVLAGSSRHWPSYRELCKEISGDRLVVIDHLDQALLASAFAAARVHTLTSWMDTCGLVSLEAALTGTPVVGSTFGHELEYLKNDAWLADPADPKSIREAIEKAWDEGSTGEKCIKLKNRIIKEYNWENTANKTLDIYKEVVGKG